jgi:hypothetical protein
MVRGAQLGAQGLTFSAKPKPGGKDFLRRFFLSGNLRIHFYLGFSPRRELYAIYFSLFFAIRLGLEFLKTHRESAMQIHTQRRQRNSSPKLSFPSII